ncbi:MAG: polyprenyl synthetase family protein [Cytophagales bacterium]|nr:polyprenyl synthetase family protein [Cytophagales bacterium]
MSFFYQKAIEQINKSIEKTHYGHQPSELYEPIKYIMSLGGKRLRPMLTLIGYYIFNEKGEYSAALKPAIAIELFHNFSLMHDDIMDKAPLRRGKPTVHEKWNPNVAILSGDVMLVEAYKMMMNIPDEKMRHLLDRFSQTAKEVCEGQQWDMNFESQEKVSLDAYMKMIEFKTAVLLGFSVELGAWLGGATQKEAENLYEFGRNVGLAFQVMDDYLDAFGDAAKFGKQVGGDIISNKKTFLTINAFEKAKGKDKETLVKLFSGAETDPALKVKTVLEIYEKLHIKEVAMEKIESLYQTAQEHLQAVKSVGPFKRNLLKKYTDSLMERES